MQLFLSPLPHSRWFSRFVVTLASHRTTLHISVGGTLGRPPPKNTLMLQYQFPLPPKVCENAPYTSLTWWSPDLNIFKFVLLWWTQTNSVLFIFTSLIICKISILLYVQQEIKSTRYPNLHSSSATYELCDFGPVALPLWASVPSFVKWRD